MSDGDEPRLVIPEPNCFTRRAGVGRWLRRNLGHLRMRLRYLGQAVAFDPTCTLEPTSRLKVVEGGSITLGRYCEIYDYALLITYGGNITLGDYCSVNQFAVIYGHGGLRVGNGVRIAAHTVIIPANHNFDATDVPICLQGETKVGIVIEDDVWIGAGCRILDGVTIHRGAVIGAGSVVTKSIPADAIAVGLPARVIGQRGEKKSS